MITALGLGLALLNALPAQGDDWPQWLGPGRDGIWRESGILEKLPEGGPKVRWRTAIGAGYTGPAVAAGKVYLMDRILPPNTKVPPENFQIRKIGIPGTERVLCLDEGDGKILWKHEYDCPYTVSYPLGPRTTPVVHEGRVYTLGTEGHLLCLGADDGQVLWSKYFPKDYGAKPPIWGFAAHPLIDGQKLICMVGGEDSAVVAFNKDTGKEIWKSVNTSQLGYCPPRIYEAGGKRQLIIWTGNAIQALNPETGEVYWKHPVTVYQAMSIAMPRVENSQLFLTATFNFSLMLELDKAAPAAKVLWKGDRKLGFDSVFATPFVENGYVYGTSSDGDLRCIEAATGKRLWSTFEPNRGKKNRSADVFLVKNGDRFFLFNEHGDLVIARLSPEGYKEISRANLLSPTSAAFGRNVLWSHPAFANRSVYARNDKELVCFSLAAE